MEFECGTRPNGRGGGNGRYTYLMTSSFLIRSFPLGLRTARATAPTAHPLARYRVKLPRTGARGVRAVYRFLREQGSPPSIARAAILNMLRATLTYDALELEERPTHVDV